MLLRFPLPLHLLIRRHNHHQPLLSNSLQSKRFNNSPIFSHPHSLFQTVPVLRVSYPTGLGSPSTFSEDESDVELGRLLSLLPEEMRRRVSEHPELQMLIEVVMDLGRKPLARFPSGDFVISEYPITVQDIQHATAQVFLELSFTRFGYYKIMHFIYLTVPYYQILTNSIIHIDM
jgi:hypothetical protein